MPRRKKIIVTDAQEALNNVVAIANSGLSDAEKVAKIKLYTDIDTKSKEIERHKIVIESAQNKIKTLEKEIDDIKTEIKNIK